MFLFSLRSCILRETYKPDTLDKVLKQELRKNISFKLVFTILLLLLISFEQNSENFPTVLATENTVVKYVRETCYPLMLGS